jgi:DHA3 family macrolide efflux protein-like MFS transporter
MALLIANEATVGVMMSIESSGMLVGTLVMSVWGGPKRRRVWLVLAMIMVQGASLFIIAARPSIVLMTVGGFLMMLCFALIGTNMGPVFQTKVALDVQGRVFATSAFLSVILEPMGQVVVGPLTDRVFEPLMARGGALAPVLGPLIGVGPGRGMAVVFFLMGACIVGLGLYGFLNPRVRLLEEELPDVLPGEAEVEREGGEVAGSGMTPAVEFRD